MAGTTIAPRVETEFVLLGDEAVALAAVHAGVSGAYAYPGTPSTEILEYLLHRMEHEGGPRASWCVNEKTAYEQALGVSMAGKRTLVAMKHVGLNVAADPFMNSALVTIDGGFVLAVADDPGMHSSQNEQDSRYFADFAHILCLEPADPQEAYDMTRDAFDLSEQFHIPVMIRLVTRVAHSRSMVRTRDPRPENDLRAVTDKRHWILLPAMARVQWAELLRIQDGLRSWSEGSSYNDLHLEPGDPEFGVITTGSARAYFLENLDDLDLRPSHLHVGAYPFPAEKIRELAGHVKTLLVIEEGYPYLERYVRGVLPSSTVVLGKLTGHIPHDGELTPGTVRVALGLPLAEGVDARAINIPPRPPRLCQGCPHGDAYSALNHSLSGFDHELITSDIGCYTLGVLPPYSAGESCVCMGASVGMAKGAAEAGVYPVVAVIGDSTFLHSGITPLIDAIEADTDMTLLILDNEAVAMTGIQKTVLSSSRVSKVVAGLGIDPEHFHVVPAHPKKVDELSALMKKEIEHHGLSIIITVRECLESVRKRKSCGR